MWLIIEWNRSELTCFLRYRHSKHQSIAGDTSKRAGLRQMSDKTNRTMTKISPRRLKLFSVRQWNNSVLIKCKNVKYSSEEWSTSKTRFVVDSNHSTKTVESGKQGIVQSKLMTSEKNCTCIINLNSDFFLKLNLTW